MRSSSPRATCSWSAPRAAARPCWRRRWPRCWTCPIRLADATALTEAGYVGEDVETILVGLLQNANWDIGTRRPRHRLHRRNRQGDAQGRRQPQHHTRRQRRGRAAGAAQDHRGHRRQRAARTGPQAPAAGIHPARHQQHSVHLRRRLCASVRHRATSHPAARQPRLCPL